MTDPYGNRRRRPDMLVHDEIRHAQRLLRTIAQSADYEAWSIIHMDLMVLRNIADKIQAIVEPEMGKPPLGLSSRPALKVEGDDAIASAVREAQRRTEQP